MGLGDKTATILRPELAANHPRGASAFVETVTSTHTPGEGPASRPPSNRMQTQTGAFARHQSSVASPRSTAWAAGVCLASESRSCITSGGNSRSGALPVLVARTSTRLAG